ncbi:hypothetical protein ILUMI_16919 [Ignelater luminosus]|uniref:Uncharacterized protein n=1 Tax=Ignelater luminosus TaxID=2038154 RepID=A0A8K0CKU3_IGNLU|nr:hypothetical protein ILUMI_16919 [Ignelater luminosus]
MYKERETEKSLKEFLKQEDTQKGEEEGPKRHNLNSVRNGQKKRQNHTGNETVNPKEVAGAKLKKEEFIGMESNTGVTVTKWKDKREVQNILLTWWMSIKRKK